MDYNTFAGTVKKSDCTVTKLDIGYNQIDCRCWSALINQGTDNIIVTHSVNRSEYGTQCFDIFTSTKIITDVEAEDISETVDLLISKQTTLNIEPETQTISVE